MQPTFPLPEADALAHSDQLAAALRAEILAQGGAMPFSRFMELCLYTPGWGYYSAGASKFGAAGDFVTAPEMGTLFAAATANALAPALRGLGAQARVLELGGGSGAFAEAALRHLAGLDALPARPEPGEPPLPAGPADGLPVVAPVPAVVPRRMRVAAFLTLVMPARPIWVP